VANGYTQHFSGDVVITPRSTTNDHQPPEPNPWGLDVVFQGDPEIILKPSKSATLQFKAYYGSLWPYVPVAPLATKDIYYYVYTYSKVVAYGKATTDANGLFTLTVDVPTVQETFDQISFDFDAEVTTGSWQSDNEQMTVSEYSVDDYMANPEKLKDSNVQVSIDKLRVGGTSKVSAKFSGATDSTMAYVSWVPAKVNIGDLMTWSDTQAEWEQLNSGNSPMMAKKNKDYSTNIIIPEFMPKGTYTIFVVMLVPEDFNSENPYKAYHVNYLQVQAGQGGTVGGDTGLFGLGKAGGIDVGIILILVIVIVIVVIVVVALMMRRKPTAAPPGAYPPGQVPIAAQAAPPPGQQQVLMAQPVQPAPHDHAGHVHPHPHEAVPMAAPVAAPAPAPAPITPGGPTQPSTPYETYQAPPPPPTA
jgi:hypothetical protein